MKKPLKLSDFEDYSFSTTIGGHYPFRLDAIASPIVGSVQFVVSDKDAGKTWRFFNLQEALDKYNSL